MASLKRLLWFSSILATVVVAHSLSRVYAQTPDTKPKATSSITGRVMIGEKPAPGVLVAVNLINTQGVVAQVTSDAEGKYRISGLSAGQMNVSAVAPTYVLPANPMYGQGRVVNLSADETVEGIDFKLTRGGVITGRITDADGKPLIEERITLTPVDDKGEPVRGLAARPANFLVNNTDDRGIYRIYGLAAARYKVSVGDDAGRSALRGSGYYPKTYYGNTAEAAKASIVDLNEGAEVKNIDITVGGRARTYTVTGRIIDADTNQPLPGVDFSFGALQTNQNQTYLSGTYSPNTPTNSKGEFRLEGVAPGRYAIMASSNSMFNQTSNQSPKVYSDPLSFEVTDGDIADLEVKAQRGLSISGVVVTDGITDKKALAMLSRLVVAGFGEPTQNSIQGLMNGTTSPIAADGTFQLDGLRPGKVQINVSGFTGAESKGLTISRIVHERAVQNRRIDLVPGQSVSGVRIYLSYGTGAVRGQVKVEGGALPADAMMFVSVQRQGEPNGVSSAQVDSRGRFVAQGIPTGTYEVVLQIISFGPATNLPRGFARTQKQTVNVIDDSESEVLFTLDLTPKEGP
jgi:protocatechuate 3,4-dioxygenase beta subunit